MDERAEAKFAGAGVIQNGFDTDAIHELRTTAGGVGQQLFDNVARDLVAVSEEEFFEIVDVGEGAFARQDPGAIHHRANTIANSRWRSASPPASGNFRASRR